MKILYIVSTLQKSGPIIVLYNIVKYLNKNIQPIILTLSPEPEHSLKSDFENKLNTKVLSLNLSRIDSFLQGSAKIKAAARQISPDLIHTHGIRADLMTKKLLKKFKIISTVHCHPQQDYTRTYNKFLGNIMAYMHFNSIKRTTYPVVVSKHLSCQLKEKNKMDIDYIENGVDMEIFHLVDPDIKSKLREKLSLDQDKKIFISTGHITPLKNPLTIIEAFKKRNSDNAQLIFLGDGELIEECKKVSKNNRAIKFYGLVNNVNEFLQASDYYISASFTEGLPNSALEAFACGLPGILSDIPAHKELLVNQNYGGELFNPNSVDSLLNALENISKKEYKKASLSTHQVILDNYTAEIMSRKYQKVYHNILYSKEEVAL